MTPRLLIVESDRIAATSLSLDLAAEGFAPVVESTADGALRRVATEPFDLVLLDLVLADRDGLDLVRTIRRQGVRTRVLVVTARDSIADRVSSLDAGADDYVTKPFALPELIARARALLRRSPASLLPLMRFGDVSVNLIRREVVRDTVRIDLTPKEFDLLVFLMQHAEQVVTREMLARGVYGQERSASLDNLIDAHITRLRQKVDQQGKPSRILTARGVGFTLRSGGQ